MEETSGDRTATLGLVRALGPEFGDLSIRKGSPRADLKNNVVYLPHLLGSDVDEETAVAARHYLGHEAGELRYRDVDALLYAVREAPHLPTPDKLEDLPDALGHRVKSLYNWTGDVTLERAQAHRWPGWARDHERNMRTIVRDNVHEFRTDTPDPSRTLAGWIAYVVGSDALDVDDVRDLLGGGKLDAFLRRVLPVVKRMSLDTMDGAASAAVALDQACATYTREDVCTCAKCGREYDPDTGEPYAFALGTPGVCKECAEGEGGGDGDEDEDEGESGAGDPPPPDSEGPGFGEPDHEAPPLQEPQDSDLDTIEEQARERLGEQMEQEAVEADSFRVADYSETRPRTGSRGPDDYDYRRVADTLTTRLAHVLETPQERYKAGRTKGRVDNRRIGRLAAGSDRAFKRRVPRDDVDASVLVSVDLSGSMGGNRAHIAAQLALGWSEAMAALEVPCRVVGWRNGQHVQFQRWGESAGSARKKLASIDHNCGGGTPIGQGATYAVREIGERQERRRILFFFADGQAYGTIARAAREAFARAERDGIEVVPVGIELDPSESPAFVDLDSIHVPEIGDLPRKATDRLVRILDRYRREDASR